MANFASLEAPLVGSADRGRNLGGCSGRWRLVISVVSVAILVVGLLVAGFLSMSLFHAGGGVSIVVESDGSMKCPTNWCKKHGYEEDACNCGICGSYGGCSWSCNVENSKSTPRLQECNERATAWHNAMVVGFGFICIVLVMLVIALLSKVCCSKDVENQDDISIESNFGDARKTRAIMVDASPDGTSSTADFTTDREVSDVSSKQSGKVSTSDKSGNEEPGKLSHYEQSSKRSNSQQFFKFHDANDEILPEQPRQGVCPEYMAHPGMAHPGVAPEYMAHQGDPQHHEMLQQMAHMFAHSEDSSSGLWANTEVTIAEDGTGNPCEVCITLCSQR